MLAWSVPGSHRYMSPHAVVADQSVNQRTLEGVTHVQAAGDIGRRNHDAVGFAAAFRISFIDLIVFPKLCHLASVVRGRKDWARWGYLRSWRNAK